MLSFHDIEDFKEIDATLAEQAKVVTGHKGPSDADQRNVDSRNDHLQEAADRLRHST